MNNKKFDVFAIGNAIVDVIADADESLLERVNVAKGGMRLIDANEAREIRNLMGKAVETPGGSSANAIAGVASLGGRTAFSGKLGKDQPCEIFLDSLRAQGTRAALTVDSGFETGRCLILVTPDAERSMLACPGASLHAGPEDIDIDILQQSKITLVEGYIWSYEKGRKILETVIESSKTSGAKVALSLPNPEAITPARDEIFAQLENDIDIIFGNEEETLALYGVDAFDQAVRMARGNNYVAALTRSEKGSTLVHGDDVHEIPITPVHAVDATGAGDLYAAGLLYGLSQGWQLPRCGALASQTSANIVAQYGGQPRTSLASLVEKVGNSPVAHSSLNSG